MRKAPLFIAALAAFALLVFVGCKGKGHHPAKPSTAASATAGAPVSVAFAQLRDIDETVEVTGTLQPADEVIVGPHLAGRITWIIGKAGIPVKVGQLVARMEDTDAVIQVRTARAAYDAAKAHLEQAKAAFTQQRTATDSGIQNAKAALSAAEARYTQSVASEEALIATTKAQIDQATQALNAAKSHSAETYHGPRKQEIQIAQLAVNTAKATLDLDQKNFDRYQNLYDNGAIAKSTLDAAEAQLQVSKAQYDSAAQQLDIAHEGSRVEDKQAAQATVDQAQAALDAANAGSKQIEVAKENVNIASTGVDQAKAALQMAYAEVDTDQMRDKDILAAQASLEQAAEAEEQAEQQLNYTRIYSPVNGVIAEKMADVGQSVPANANVLRLTTNAALYFEAQISELAATRLHSGQTVLISVDALQGDRSNIYGNAKAQTVTGTVDRVVPVVDAATRNFTVRVLIDETAGLDPGMFARGEITVARHAQVITIPKDAMVEKNGAQLVYVVQHVTGDAAKNSAEHDSVRECTVTPGATDGTYLQIVSGLAEGDQVVTEGQQTFSQWRYGDRCHGSAEVKKLGVRMGERFSAVPLG